MKVSVALATFNGADYVAEQMASIMAQSLLPDEIVVADDGSDDRTVDLVRAAMKNTSVSLVVLERREHLGVTQNFARAIEATSHELIALCDQDDVWHPDRLLRSVEVFVKRPSTTLVHSDAVLVDEAGRALGPSLFEALGVNADLRGLINSGRAFPVLLRRNVVTGATVMFRRSLIAAATPFPEQWVHDEWLAIIASAIGEITSVDERLIEYRQHGRNQIGAASPTFRYKISRMLAADPVRNRNLAARSEVLSRRLAELRGVPSAYRADAAEKAVFEAQRAALPVKRLMRLPGVMRARAGKRYSRFASQGRLDILRDLLQPR